MGLDNLPKPQLSTILKILWDRNLRLGYRLVLVPVEMVVATAAAAVALEKEELRSSSSHRGSG